MTTNMEEIMKHLNLIIITSTNKCSAEEWQYMETSLMQTLKTTEEYGGMNIILERKLNPKLYKCNQCDFRANTLQLLCQHKRRTHSDYRLV